MTAPRKGRTQSIVRLAARHPWWTIAVWVVVLLGMLAAIFNLLSTATTTDQGFTVTPESMVAQHLLDQKMHQPTRIVEIAILQSKTLTVDDPAFRAAVTQFVQSVAKLGPDAIDFKNGVPQIASYYTSQNESFVSQDRHATIVPMTLAGDLGAADAHIGAIHDLADSEAAKSGMQIQIAGPASVSQDFKQIAEKDLRHGETLGIAIALAILLIVFRTVGAAWIPIVVALGSIGISVGIVALVGQLYQLSFFVTNMISMIGLAVGIDYTLFITARFREERASGLGKVDAIVKAGNTAGKAVLFSGITVILALLGIVLVPTTVFLSLGLGAVIAVAVTLVASVTLLPAILSLSDRFVDAWRLPLPGARGSRVNQPSGFWHTVSHAVMRHPWPALIVSAALLISAAVPYFQISTGSGGVSTLPNGAPSKSAFLTLEKEFPNAMGSLSSADIVIDGQANSPAVLAGVQRLKAEIAKNSVFGETQYATSSDGTLGLLSAVITVDGASKAATEAVSNLRNQLIPDAQIPAKVYVGGQTAQELDFLNLSNHWTPIVIAIVLCLSFILLTVVFRSLVVPIKAIILNLLSVGTAYGLLVLVIQKGFLIHLFGFQQVNTIETWIPVFLFSILFGLSMDYEVFLLSRIRERYDQTHMNTESVAFGVRSTGGIITGAALIMVAVFAGFASGSLTMFQQLGFGLGVAIFVDATVVRVILVPAAMRLLGDANWYLPKALHWLPDLRTQLRE